MQNIRQTSEYIELKRKFDDYYTSKLYPILEQSNHTRKRYIAAFAALLLMAFVFYPLLWYLWHNGILQDSAVGIILALSGMVILWACGPFYRCHKKIKPQIMPIFADFFGSFSYTFEGKIDDALLRRSNLFKNYDKSVGDDFFCGTYNGVRINIAEEKLLQIKRDFRNFEVKKKVFGGICVLLEMNKNFKGRTIVLKDGGILGNTLNKIAGLQNVRLEDSHFEKIFEVYSDDQVEARYLLTTGFMERMLKLRDLYDGKSVQFCFDNNKLLLSVPTSYNMFEADSFFRSNTNKAKIDIVFDQFYLIFSIINLLKLNQKIGL